MAKLRPNGEGMIRQKKKGQWEGRIVVGHKTDGKPIYRYVYAKTQKDLVQKLHQKIELYQDVELNENCNMTLSEWLDKWLNEYMTGTVRESTLKGYRNHIEAYIKPNLGHKQIAFITTADVQSMYNKLKKQGRVNEHPIYKYELSDSMVVDIHRVLHKAMKTVVQKHLIPTNPTEKTVRPKIIKKDMQVLTNEQLDKFLKVIDTEDEWYDFFYTELTTGLQWDDLDMNTGELKISRQVAILNGKMHITEPKTKTSVRTIILPAEIVKMLKEYKKTINSKWLFPSPVKEDMPKNPSAVRKILDRTLEKADCKHIRFHDLRHTFATTALANGMDIKTLSAIIGHNSAETTLNIYTHITDEMQKSAAKKIGQNLRRDTNLSNKDSKP